MTNTQTTDRDATIQTIRAELKRRSGKTWSVKGDRGTAWGWITITAPPSRLIDGWKMTDEDAAELAQLLGFEKAGHQGWTVAPDDNYYREYIDRARGLSPTVIGTPWWD